ncbi:MAG: hypothetical protein ACKV2T_08975, partial [Kofleriaceae bacterium]
ADGVAVGLLYLDGDPKNAEVIKWSTGFLALALVFRGGPLLRAGMKILGKIPIVTTAVKSYNALLAAFKALNALLKKKCWIWPKKVGFVPPGADAGVVVVATGPESPDAGVVETPTIAKVETPTQTTTPTDTITAETEVTMDSIESAFDDETASLVLSQSDTPADSCGCDCLCTAAPQSILDDIVTDAVCSVDDSGCCGPDDDECSETQTPTPMTGSAVPVD